MRCHAAAGHSHCAVVVHHRWADALQISHRDGRTSSAAERRRSVGAPHCSRRCSRAVATTWYHLVHALTMLRQATSSPKRPSAVLTHVRSEALVQHQSVPFSVARLRKRRVAQFTFVRPRALVHRLDVLSELVLLRKAGRALRAFERPQLEVHRLDVLRQVGRLRVRLAA